MPAHRRLDYWMYRVFWSGLDLIYPPLCGGCEKPGARWCSECRQAAEVIRVPVCPRCGKMQSFSKECSRCRSAPPAYEAARSWALFNGPVRNALHRLKYKREVALGDVLAENMAAVFEPLAWQVDLVTPVPISIARLAERGYNQATLLARPFALGVGLAFRPKALTRVRETRSQVDLTVTERKKNVTGAFQASPQLVQGRRVLVIDDVMTSGATLEACAGALLAAGANRVYCLTLARAM